MPPVMISYFSLISIQKSETGVQGDFIGDVEPFAQNTKYLAAALHYWLLRLCGEIGISSSTAMIFLSTDAKCWV